MREVSCSIHVLKKPWGRGNMHLVFEEFFCANMHFKAKPMKVVRKEGDPFFDVVPGFKSKFAVVYTEHAE